MRTAAHVSETRRQLTSPERKRKRHPYERREWKRGGVFRSKRMKDVVGESQPRLGWLQNAGRAVRLET